MTLSRHCRDAVVALPWRDVVVAWHCRDVRCEVGEVGEVGEVDEVTLS